MDLADRKYAVCVACGHRWNISAFARIPNGGYICPTCEVLLRKYPLRVVISRMKKRNRSRGGKAK